MRKLDVADRWRLDADELSGLGLRRHGPAPEPELLVVGDSGFRVLTSGLTEDDPQGRSPKLDDQVDSFTTGRSSQWEGVTADGSGRVFILQEHPGHVFVVSLRNGFPINVLGRIQQTPEVVNIYCATANPVEVVLAETEQGRGVLGVIDGGPPKGVETESHVKARIELMQKFGYKR